MDCTGSSASGSPTIVLVSGYHDSADVWSQSDLLSLLKPAVGPPVQPALAAQHRVCSYDRPGTIRYREGVPLTDRSTPVKQPRTLADLVDELHAVLAAAHVPTPYLIVGHSLGGLLTLLYGRTYPEQVAGIVFVDAFSPTFPKLLGPNWPIYRDRLAQGPSSDPASEVVDMDASLAQVEAAKPLSVGALAVLTKTEPFAGLGDLPGLPATVINRGYEQANDYFVGLAPATPHTFATGSDHYVQFSQPDLIVHSTELILGRVRGAAGT